MTHPQKQCPAHGKIWKDCVSWSLMVEDDIMLHIRWFMHIWFHSAKVETYIMMHVGNGMQAAGTAAEAAPCLWSCVAVRQWSSSKFVSAFLTSAHQLDLSKVEDSKCLGLISAYLT